TFNTLHGGTFLGGFTSLVDGATFTPDGKRVFRINYTATTVVLTHLQDLSGTTLVSSLNPSGVGDAVTFTATVISDTGNGTPTGNVTFVIDGVGQAPAVALNASGVATFTTSTLPFGTHTVTAVYAGDANFVTSTSNIINQVVLFHTTTALTSSVNPSVFGEA